MNYNIERVRQYLLFGDGDLKTAINELETGDHFTNAICFHSQQATEKYLKAYLIVTRQTFPKTHDLSLLVEICKIMDPTFDELYSINIQTLTRYAVEVRYPDEFYVPTEEEAREAVEIAKKVRDFVINKLREKGIKL